MVPAVLAITIQHDGSHFAAVAVYGQLAIAAPAHGIARIQQQVEDHLLLGVEVANESRSTGKRLESYFQPFPRLGAPISTRRSSPGRVRHERSSHQTGHNQCSETHAKRSDGET